MKNDILNAIRSLEDAQDKASDKIYNDLGEVVEKLYDIINEIEG